MTDIRDSTGIVNFDTKSEIIVNVVVEGKSEHNILSSCKKRRRRC